MACSIRRSLVFAAVGAALGVSAPSLATIDAANSALQAACGKLPPAAKKVEVSCPYSKDQKKVAAGQLLTSLMPSLASKCSALASQCQGAQIVGQANTGSSAQLGERQASGANGAIDAAGAGQSFDAASGSAGQLAAANQACQAAIGGLQPEIVQGLKASSTGLPYNKNDPCDVALNIAHQELTAVQGALQQFAAAQELGAQGAGGLAGSLKNAGAAMGDMMGNPLVMGTLGLGAGLAVGALMNKKKGGEDDKEKDDKRKEEGFEMPNSEATSAANDCSMQPGMQWSSDQKRCMRIFAAGVDAPAPGSVEGDVTTTVNVDPLTAAALRDPAGLGSGLGSSESASSESGSSRGGGTTGLASGASGASAGGSGAGSLGGSNRGGDAAGGGSALAQDPNYLGGFFGRGAFGSDGSGNGGAENTDGVAGFDSNHIDNPNGRRSANPLGTAPKGNVKRVSLSLKEFCAKNPRHSRCTITLDPLLK